MKLLGYVIRTNTKRSRGPEFLDRSLKSFYLILKILDLYKSTKIENQDFQNQIIFFKGLSKNSGIRDLFVLVLITYLKSFMTISQKMKDEIDFPVRFSGQAIENCARNTITLQR